MVFPGCKANAGTVTSRGPTLPRKTLTTQGCGRTVKFCLRTVLNPRLGYENNCLLSSDASRMQEWKQHGGRRYSCFALETPPPVRFFDPDPVAAHAVRGSILIDNMVHLYVMYCMSGLF